MVELLQCVCVCVRNPSVFFFFYVGVNTVLYMMARTLTPPCFNRFVVVCVYDTQVKHT